MTEDLNENEAVPFGAGHDSTSTICLLAGFPILSDSTVPIDCVDFVPWLT